MAQSQENQGVTPFCTFLSVKDGIIHSQAVFVNQIFKQFPMQDFQTIPNANSFQSSKIDKAIR